MNARRKFGLNSLLASLFTNQAPAAPEDSQEGVFQTTIRLDAKEKNFVQFHSDLLGISQQDMMALMIKGISRSTTNPQRTEYELAFDRFIQLLAEHEIPQIHCKQLIESVTGEQFPLGCLSNQDKFFNIYSPSIKGITADFFSVSPLWLEGGNTNPLIVNPIYSRDLSFKIIQEVKNSLSVPNLNLTNSSLLVIKDERRTANGLPEEVLLYKISEWSIDEYMHFKTYKPLGIFQLLSDEANICLKAILHYCDHKIGIPINGITTKPNILHALKGGALPANSLKGGFPDIFSPASLYDASDCEETNHMIDLLSC